MVANGDEGDPGSYADRLLMEADPARVLEGLALACFACGARQGMVLVRSEYPLALARMRAAVDRGACRRPPGPAGSRQQCRSGRRGGEGAGSYVAGEETALHRRAGRRPWLCPGASAVPDQQGLWDAPTVVNNVETLAAVPWIVAVRRRAPTPAAARPARPVRSWSACPSGSPGLAAYEVELGMPVRRIVSELGGGLADGAELTCLAGRRTAGGIPGRRAAGRAADGGRLSPSRGAALGHAGLVAFDQRVRPQEVLRHVWEFAAAESCGACSPCRVGSRRGLDLATAGDPPGEEYARLLRVMGEASLCAFGGGYRRRCAASPAPLRDG